MLRIRPFIALILLASLQLTNFANAAMSGCGHHRHGHPPAVHAAALITGAEVMSLHTHPHSQHPCGGGGCDCAGGCAAACAAGHAAFASQEPTVAYRAGYTWTGANPRHVSLLKTPNLFRPPIVAAS